MFPASIPKATVGQAEQKNLPNDKRYQWASPLIEGLPPSARGGHSATKIGRIVIIFGGHYYSGKEKGFTYLNDTHVLDIDNNKWIVILIDLGLKRLIVLLG